VRDVGGVAFLLRVAASAATQLFTYNKMHNLLVAELYKKPMQYWATKEEIKGTKIMEASE